jgi:hypothetical protein
MSTQFAPLTSDEPVITWERFAAFPNRNRQDEAGFSPAQITPRVTSPQYRVACRNTTSVVSLGLVEN